MLGSCTPALVNAGALVADRQKVPLVTGCDPLEAFKSVKPQWKYAWDLFFHEPELAALPFQTLKAQGLDSKTNKRVAILADNGPDGQVAHFWLPPYLVDLVEVVESEATDAAAVERVMALLAGAGMTPVHVRADIPGFVGNRLQHALKREAIALVAAGVCDAETVDTVVKRGFGARLGLIGPLEQSDLVGLDLTLAIHEVLMPSLDTTPEPHPDLVARVKRGDVGARAGRGFRTWGRGEAEALRAHVDAELAAAARRRQSR